jgi:hypothetical protein
MASTASGPFSQIVAAISRAFASACPSGYAEARALAGDPDLGRLEDLGAAGDRDAFDRGDDRLRRPVAAQQGLPVKVRIGLHARLHVDRSLLARIACHGAQVRPRTEVPARARQDDAADVGIVRGLDIRVVHEHEHLARQRVHALGTVQGDDQALAVALDDRVGHGGSSFGGVICAAGG